MGITEDMADDLARDSLEAANATDNQKIVDEVSEVLGATSATAQEAYLTAIRVRRAVKRARETLDAYLKKSAEKVKSK